MSAARDLLGDLDRSRHHDQLIMRFGTPKPPPPGRCAWCSEPGPSAAPAGSYGTEAIAVLAAMGVIKLANGSDQ